MAGNELSVCTHLNTYVVSAAPCKVVGFGINVMGQHL